MKDKLLNDWNFMRVVKLLLGIYVAYDATVSKQYFLLVLAALFLYQAVFNVSPCGVAGCAVNPNPIKEKQ
jgi:uncharacterized membrane protein HdeD (DUF308 family)